MFMTCTVMRMLHFPGPSRFVTSQMCVRGKCRRNDAFVLVQYVDSDKKVKPVRHICAASALAWPGVCRFMSP